MVVHPRRLGATVGALVALVVVTRAQQAPATAPTPSAAEAISRLERPRDPSAQGPAAKPLADLLTDTSTPSVSVAVVKNYEIVLAHAWGLADPDTKLEARPDTIYQAASISKPVAAMAVLRAVQDGVFGLDDDINTILKSWKLIQKAEFLQKTKVTPRLLMSMTAGATVGGFPGYLPTDPLPTVPQVLGYDGDGRKTPANTKPVVIDWEPNTKYEYSGGGVTILQLALTEATATPFADFVQKSVLAPIGMSMSCYCQPLPADKDRNAARATGWAVNQDTAIGRGGAKWHVYPELYAAGLWTTPTDLARFMIEVQQSLAGRSNKVLTREMVRKMVTPGGIGAYALGFTVGSDSPHRPARPGEAGRYFGHTGGNWGFRSDFEAHLEGGNGFVIMANSDDANPLIFQELPARIRAVYGW
ncbi:MAG: serine hydrolase domain-containing protein [Vicinamibacterales bacterium]